MRKLSLLTIFTLLLTGCTSSPEIPAAVGIIPDCSTIERTISASNSLEMPCLDGSEIINFHAGRGWVRLEPRAVVVLDYERLSKRGR